MQDLTPTSQTPVAGNAPPAVPRAVTPLVARRAWTEPSVRVWWLMAGAVIVVFVSYSVDRLWERETLRRLIRDGAVVQAKMMGNSLKSIRGQTFSPGDIVQVQFDWNGQEVQPAGAVHSSVTVGQMITIRVDRNDSAIWTDLTESEPLLASLFVGFLFLPLAFIAFAVAYAMQRAVLLRWQNGEAVVAVVHDRRQTPIAPMSYAVRCSLRDQRDKRLVTVYVPQRAGVIAEGTLIWVIISKGKTRPVAALWFA